MLRTRSAVRPVGPADLRDALALCERDLAANVFVASRILDGAADRGAGSVLGFYREDRLASLCWAGANVVPVETDEESRAAYAERLRRSRHRCASILGPSDQVAGLWSALEPHWGAPRTVRVRQPLLGTATPPSAHGIPLDPRVRPARRDEVDLVVPAAAHMFTHEIGYAPYVGSPRGYRSSIADLVARGQTYVIVEEGRVVFKADVGSVALGCAQIQGVWLEPELRGQGRSVPAMAAVLEQVMPDHAGFVTLYVNDFNAAALALYRRLGMADLGTFSTVLL